MIKRREFTGLALAAAGLALPGLAAAQGGPVEGTHYVRLNTPVPVPEPVARALFSTLFRLGLYHTPTGAMDFLKYPCTVDGSLFERTTGFRPLFTLEDIFASVRH